MQAVSSRPDPALSDKALTTFLPVNLGHNHQGHAGGGIGKDDPARVLDLLASRGDVIFTVDSLAVGVRLAGAGK